MVIYYKTPTLTIRRREIKKWDINLYLYIPRFLYRPTAFCSTCWGRQSALHNENSGFAAPTLGWQISTFRGYRILFSSRNPYIIRFTNNFSIHS
jgi:hypothetical protein